MNKLMFNIKTIVNFVVQIKKQNDELKTNA